jgi:L-iditol 2-dehydrogenase
MRAAMYHGAGRIELTELPRPVAGAGELVVRVHACGLCGSDLMQWYQDPRAPLVLGHEPVGVVVDAGEGATVAVGSRVFVHHHVPCGACAYCRQGRETLCATFRATRIDPGGLAEFIRVPAENARLDVLVLPDGLSDLAGTLIEPLACVVRGQARAGLGPGDPVVVLGVGAMGLLEILAARVRGTRVIALEPRPERRALARRAGAEAPEPPTATAARQLLGPEGARAVFVTTAAPEAIAAGIELAGPAGLVQLFAPPRPGHPVPIDLGAAWFREVRIESTFSAGPADTRHALQLLRDDAIDPELVISHRIPLAEVDHAFRLARSAEAMKVVVDISH